MEGSYTITSNERITLLLLYYIILGNQYSKPLFCPNSAISETAKVVIVGRGTAIKMGQMTISTCYSCSIILSNDHERFPSSTTKFTGFGNSRIEKCKTVGCYKVVAMDYVTVIKGWYCKPWDLFSWTGRKSRKLNLVKIHTLMHYPLVPEKLKIFKSSWIIAEKWPDSGLLGWLLRII